MPQNGVGWSGENIYGVHGGGQVWAQVVSGESFKGRKLIGIGHFVTSYVRVGGHLRRGF